ncbi:heme ABC transporter permease [Aliikangiella sp. IMCC44359]|uniref:heme ABC transporter permease n=1 Tax=Aliikangiella sp. IMCC44359 TaxID=3459125 RepID=UPI00403A8E6F
MSARLITWLSVITLLLFVIGLILGLLMSPADYQQGNTVRIMYIHVPAAYMSMMAYVIMAITGAIGLVWRIKMAHIVSISCASVGAIFTALALLTGAIWGRPTWGTYWVWDARLTSELILLFLYLGFIALHSAFDEKQKADKAAAVLALVGLVNIPIIHFSVEWWNTLHQGATLSKFEKPSMDTSMLWPLLIMIFAFKFYFFLVLTYKVRAEILIREKQAKWVKKLAIDKDLFLNKGESKEFV